jgi:hypothetical protein
MISLMMAEHKPKHIRNNTVQECLVYRDGVLLLIIFHGIWDGITNYRNEACVTVHTDSKHISSMRTINIQAHRKMWAINLECSSSGLLLMLDLYHHVRGEG